MLVIVMLLTYSCAEKGYYYAQDKVSSRYSMYGGANSNMVRLNKAGRMEGIFREPTTNLVPMWYKEARQSVHDQFEVANTISDLTDLMRGKAPIYGKYKERAIDDALSYYTKIIEKSDGGAGRKSLSLKEAKKLMKMEQMYASDTMRYRHYRQELQKMEEEQKIAYVELLNTRLGFLQGIYIQIHKNDQDRTRQSRWSDSALKGFCSPTVFRQLTQTVHGNREDMKFFRDCFTDGQFHDSQEYVFSYLFGDPGRVKDLKLAKLMFGDTDRLHIWGADKALERFIVKKDTSRCLGKYFFPTAANEWYCATMGKSDVYVRISGGIGHFKITGLINPIRRVCVID